MALRGQGTGGYMFALPDTFDDGADLSAFLWIRRGSNPSGNSRVFNLVNGSRTRGFVIHIGGNASGTTQISDILISASSTNENTWGAGGNQGGRGRATVYGLSDTEFCPLAFSIRGSRAPDNTGSGGAQQIHEVWWKGEYGAADVATGLVGSGVPRPGGHATVLCRESSSLAALDGWVAEVAVWQDYRLNGEDAARLSRGASPLSVRPDKLLFYRSFRQSLDAEVSNTAMTRLGAGASLDAANHPPLLIEGSSSTHGATGRAAPLTAQAAAGLETANARHGWRGRQPALAAAGRLHAQGARHGMDGGRAPLRATAGRLAPRHGWHELPGGSALLLPLAGLAAVLHVPPEERLLVAGEP